MTPMTFAIRYVVKTKSEFALKKPFETYSG